MKYYINIEVELSDGQAEVYARGQDVIQKATFDAVSMMIWTKANGQIQQQLDANRHPMIGDLIQEQGTLGHWVPVEGDKRTWVYLGKDAVGNRYGRTEPEGRVFTIITGKPIRVDQRKRS